MYWIPKLHKNPVGFRFLIASNNCSTKPLSKAFSNVFKTIYSQIENFHRKSKFLSNSTNSGYSKMLILSENVNFMNRKKKAKSIASYDFSTLYTTHPHDKLVKRLCNVINFVLKRRK